MRVTPSSVFLGFCFVTLYEASASYLSPVILVPGDGGSRLEARLDKPSVVDPICIKKNNWFDLWLNLIEFFPEPICWADNIRLVYNNITRETQNSLGVDIQVPGWGDPESVEWIDTSHIPQSAIFHDIANELVSLGYERAKSIRAAPYDFRKAPNENDSWFSRLKTLVEDTYTINAYTPITFITHSMGSPMTLIFLQQQSRQWKQKYIKQMISLAGAWAGSMKALQAFVMGENLIPFVSNEIMREVLRTYPSTAFLLPSNLLWGCDDVIVETPSRKYNVSLLKEFFEDINYETGWEMRKDVMRYAYNLSPPDVELHCLYGVGLATVEKLVYNTDNITDAEPKLVFGDGDGTVNLRSLQVCNIWTDIQQKNVHVLKLSEVNHLEILKSNAALNYIKKILS